MTKFFPGQRFVRLLESEMKRDSARSRKGVLPVRSDPVEKEVIRTYHLEELYGYRGCDERVYYLSPWEFLMFWEVQRVPSPKKSAEDEDAHNISKWTGVKIPKGSRVWPSY